MSSLQLQFLRRKNGLILVLFTTATIRCAMHFEAFPFDLQFCEISLYLTDYNVRHANLKWADLNGSEVLFAPFELGDLFPLRKYIKPNCTTMASALKSCAKIGILCKENYFE